MLFEFTGDGSGAGVDAFDVVSANVEVGQRIDTSEFDGKDEVGFCGFLLSA